RASSLKALATPPSHTARRASAQSSPQRTPRKNCPRRSRSWKKSLRSLRFCSLICEESSEENSDRWLDLTPRLRGLASECCGPARSGCVVRGQKLKRSSWRGTARKPNAAPERKHTRNARPEKQRTSH